MSLQLGCLVDPLSKQLSDYDFDPAQMDHFQRDMEAISRAHVRHLIPYSQAMKAYDKLSNKIVAHIKERNKPTNEDTHHAR